VQVALSLVLLTSAALLGRSLQNLQAQDFGFATAGRYVVSVPPSLSTIPFGELDVLYARMRARLAAIPGVTNAAFSLYAPMSGDNWSSGITVDGHDPSERLQASWNRVSPRYFETIGTPVIRGRVFDERDTPSSPPVALVSQRFARQFFGDADPIGRRIGFATNKGGGTRDFEIVGLVGDAKYQDGRDAPNPTFYLPFLQQPASRRTAGLAARPDRSHYPQALELQTAGAVPAFETEIRRALADVDPRITVGTVVAMDEQVARQFNLERLIARLTTAFGATALLLACLGLYGVTAYSVARRTREIGIRIALGQPPSRVRRAVIIDAAGALLAGLVPGVVASWLVWRWLESVAVVRADLFVALASVAGIFLLAGTAAAIGPAWRASRVDPLVALRSN